MYTNSWPMVRALKKKFGQGAEYIRDGVILAWQFRIPRRFVEMLKRNFRKIAAVRDRRRNVDRGTGQGRGSTWRAGVLMLLGSRAGRGQTSACCAPSPLSHEA